MIVHATAVALPKQRGLMIIGDSGMGKSTLALELITHFGAILISDDLVQVENGFLSPPDSPYEGCLELRGVGILTLPFVSDIPLDRVIKLSGTAEERLPASRTWPEDQAGGCVPFVELKAHQPLLCLKAYWVVNGGLV